jgi:predicted O-methyltransferase YrrM
MAVWAEKDHVTIIESLARGLSQDNKLDYYLELGVEWGAVFNTVAPLVKNIAVAVDINAQTFESIKHNKYNLEWHNCSTEEYFFKKPFYQFDLVFIDACHHGQFVIRDFHYVYPLVREGGIILLHDVYPPDQGMIAPHFCSDAYKAMDDIKRDYGDRCEVATLPVYYGIGFVRKTTKQLCWRDSR